MNLMGPNQPGKNLQLREEVPEVSLKISAGIILP